MVRTQDPPFTRQTGFKVDTVDVRFGLLTPPDGASFADWTNPPQIARLEGAGLIVTQILLAAGPRQATYRLFLPTVAEARALEGLQTLTGTLTLYHGMHTAPVPNARAIAIHGRMYDKIDNVTLLQLANRIVFPTSGSVEVDATFQVS